MKKKKNTRIISALLLALFLMSVVIGALPVVAHASEDAQPRLSSEGLSSVNGEQGKAAEEQGKAAEEQDKATEEQDKTTEEQDKATEALKKQIEDLKKQNEDLKKIISLNVEGAESIPVLLYHHVMNEKDMTQEHRNNHNIVSTEQFEAQMKYLHDNKYYTASIEELEQLLDGRAILPKRTVVITFDDGYRSNTRYCYPILKRYGFKASIFLITGLIGARQNVIEHATWTDLHRSADVFSFYSHSHELHKLDKNGKSLMASSSQSVIRRDLLASRSFVDGSYFAFPYGQSSATVVALLRRTGFRMAFTIETGYVDKQANVYELPRFSITPLVTTEEFGKIISGAH